jgi:hypothetical protein
MRWTAAWTVVDFPNDTNSGIMSACPSARPYQLPNASRPGEQLA